MSGAFDCETSDAWAQGQIERLAREKAERLYRFRFGAHWVHVVAGRELNRGDRRYLRATVRSPLTSVAGICLSLKIEWRKVRDDRPGAKVERK